MPSTTAKKTKATTPKSKPKRVVLHTPEQAEEYIRKNLKPAGFSPSGLPFYNIEDLKKLDMRFKM